MTMLAFMPWFDFGEQLDLPGFSLLPFRRALLPSGKDSEDQKTINAIFGFYQTLAGPVSTGTILRLEGHGIADELTEQEREDVFMLATLICFSGLAVRNYFGWGHDSYCNADLFTCYIQAFSTPFPGAAIHSRRRDGQHISSGHPSVYKVLCPFHIPRTYKRGLDQSLLKALASVRKEAWASPLIEAITWFNLANTDSDTLHEPAELVAISGAFQSALGLTSARIDRFAKAWISAFVPQREVPLAESQRQIGIALKSFGSIREAWIRDLYRLRHPYAHGRQRTGSGSTWTLREHLLLASFAFPLLVKSILAKRGIYEFNLESRRRLDSFEKLAAMPELFSEKAQSVWVETVAGYGLSVDEKTVLASPTWGRS